jgi:hypothetical protein
LDILDTRDAELIKLAKEAIAATLRNIEPYEDVELDPRLAARLTQEEDPELVIATLNALRKFGDTRSIEPMEQLAEGKGRVPKARKEQIAVLSRMALADVRMREAKLIIDRATPSQLETPEERLQQGL